jgi:hypothetical protein
VTASNTIVTPEVDWQAAANVAESLGAHTRELVLEGNAEALKEWCLQQASAHVGAGNAVRSLSYFELAVIAGHRPDGLVAELRKPWGRAPARRREADGRRPREGAGRG